MPSDPWDLRIHSCAAQASQGNDKRCRQATYIALWPFVWLAATYDEITLRGLSGSLPLTTTRAHRNIRTNRTQYKLTTYILKNIYKLYNNIVYIYIYIQVRMAGPFVKSWSHYMDSLHVNI